ncbi:gas vesicle protein GvpO, halophile-type [Saliphagus sp. GCM10025334]
MAEAESASTDQCKAITSSGERCSRPAQEDGFCHQHGPDDETVDEEEASENADESATEGSATEDTDETDETGDTSEDSQMNQQETTDPDAVDTDDVDIEAETDDDQLEGFLAIRRRIERAADSIIGHPLDTISEISPTDEGWVAVVDVIERRAVPDTQDILGRYELTLDSDGAIQGYQRLDRFRRGDTVAFE